jgi:hypothetical protein
MERVVYKNVYSLTYMFYTTHSNLKDEDNEIEEEETNAALKKVLILLDQGEANWNVKNFSRNRT